MIHDLEPTRIACGMLMRWLISEVLQTHPISHWTEALDRHDVANDPVQTAEQVIADP